MSYLSTSQTVRKGPEKKTSIRRGMEFLPQGVGQSLSFWVNQSRGSALPIPSSFALR